MVNYAYLRVSTTAQDIANQKLRVLDVWLKRQKPSPGERKKEGRS